MFDKTEHPQIASEKRQLGQANQQHLQALAAEDDQTFIHQKEEREDLVRWQQDVSDELFGLRYALKRYIQHADGTWHKQLIFTGNYDKTGQPVYKELKPLINENGIAMIETQIRPLISRNMIMSNFNEKRILSFLRRTMDVVVDNMADNYDVYELDFHDMDTVYSLTLNYIMPSPYRAMNNGERKHLTTVTKRVETMSEHGQPVQEKKKLLGIF
jgi:hypothetical protein